jgi:RHS repeat-associated protein
MNMSRNTPITVLPRRLAAALVAAAATALVAAAAAAPPAPAPGSTTPAATTPAVTTPATTARQAVLDNLLRGTDARGAIAAALAAGEAPAASKQAAQASAGSGFAAAGTALHATLTRQPRDTAGISAQRKWLDAQLSALQAQRLLLELKLDQDQATLRRRGQSAAAQAQQHSQQLRDWLRRVGAAAATLKSGLAGLDARQAVPDALRAELRELLAVDAAAAQPAIYGAATLPLHRPRFAAREPAMTPAIVPSYASSSEDVQPAPEDYAATPEAPLSQTILAQARELGNDYARIHDFVRSQIRTTWYAGALQDADTTLRTRSGNDVDQASLLIALLRASRAPARYVRGVLEVPAADLAASLGVRNDKIGLALAAAGVPARPVIRAGRIAAYAIEHTYVSAFLPISNYRGTSADFSGRAWIALAPALKPHTLQPAGGALARAGVTTGGFIDDYLAEPRSDAPLLQLRQLLSARLAVLNPPLSYDSQLASLDVTATPLELLPLSLPAAELAVTGEYAALPDSQRQHTRIVVYSGADSTGTPSIDLRLPTAALAYRRITLVYEPASIADGAITDAHAGMGRTPPYLFQVRPVLMVDGQPAHKGSQAIDAAATHRLDVSLESPAGSGGFSQQLTAAGYAALVLDTQAAAPQPQYTDELPADNEHRAARLLANFGGNYLSGWNDADRELANLAGVSVIRPLPSAALVINQYRVDRIGGLADAMTWRGVALDAAFRPAEAFAHIDAPTAESDWTALSALQGSMLEHQQFELQWRVTSLSADKGLALARSQGIPILTLTAATGSGGISHPPAVIAAVDAWLARGLVVDIPATPITLQAWSGSVWRVRSLSSGEAGYFIAGSLAGGSTAMPPELWYLEDLVDILGNPYGREPNLNALAGAILTLDRSSNEQEGKVDNELDEPLRAFVLDETGRPVKDALVTFKVLVSNSELIGENSQQGGQVQARTDGAGMAQARLKLGTKLGDTGHYEEGEDGPELQWVGHAVVDVSAESALGTLRSGEALIAYMWPGAAEKLEVKNSGGLVLPAGIGFGRIDLTVTDSHDNAVSNVPVSVNMSHDYSSVDCDVPGFGERVDGGLFESIGPEGCPDDPLLTGNSCANRRTLQLTSRYFGARFYVAPPSHPRVNFPVTINAAGKTEVEELRTDSETGCSGLLRVFVSTLQYVNNLGQNAFAAKTGDRIDVPYKVTLYASELGMHDEPPGPHAAWYGVSGGTVREYEALQHGSLDASYVNSPGRYDVYVRASDVPGEITGLLSIKGVLEPHDDSLHNLPYEFWVRGIYNEAGDNFSYGWSVDLNATRVEPDRVALDVFKVTTQDVQLRADYRPEEWMPGVLQLLLYKNGELADGCVFADMPGTTPCTIRRGLEVDPEADYTAKTVLDNGIVRLESEPVEVQFKAPIIAGYGMLSNGAVEQRNAGRSSDGGVGDLIPLLTGKFPANLTVREDIDAATGYVCATAAELAYVLAQPARVEIKFFQRNLNGQPTGPSMSFGLAAQDQPAGLHTLEILPGKLPVGSFAYELSATSAEGVTDKREGNITVKRERQDSLTLAHSFVKGVDLYSGGAVLSEDDIVLGGRGPGIKLARTYSSHGGDRPGFYGRGWSADLDMQVTGNACGQRIVSGGAGQGQRFVSVGQEPDGSERYRPLHGYHGVLLFRRGEYDFIAKDGTRYHFAQPDPQGPRLSYVIDTNGNRVDYEWEAGDGEPRVTRMRDSAGREVVLEYQNFVVSRPVGNIDIVENYTLLRSAEALGYLRVDYEYDDYANLVRATRSDESGIGTRRSRYVYQDYDGIFYTQPDGQMTYARLGFRLSEAYDDIAATRRLYSYGAGPGTPPYWTGTQSSDGVLFTPEIRVTRVTEPDESSTEFTYDDNQPAVRGLLPAPVTQVRDGRGKPTTYTMNRYGAVTQQQDAAGLTVTTWDLVHLQPQTITDPLLGITSYTYDDEGNKRTETVITPHGQLSREWTYYPPDSFDAPHVRNRVHRFTDARGIVTENNYDRRGNLTSTARGGVTTRNSYADNGDMTGQVDGNGKAWTLRYDTFGYPKERQSPLGHVTKTDYDALGRKYRETDANGNATEWTHDARDRVRVTYLPGDVVQTAVYDDRLRTRTLRNGRNITTLQKFDRMLRLIEESTGDDSRTLKYDANGNLEEETDFGGHLTTYEYDDVNRLLFRREAAGSDAAEQRTTAYEYDALGHVTRERVGQGPAASGQARLTEYEYQHPTYARTEVRRQLDGAGGTRWLVQTTGYDPNGNPTSSTDALQRATTRVFDNRDRLESENAPLGKVTTYTYDGRDQKRSETRSNAGGSGPQTREWIYDADGRVSSQVDANGKAQLLGYDSTTNVTARTDARGGTTRYEYDERNNLVEEKGPEAGQVTTYTYDNNNNRTGETWGNGRILTHVYDNRDRRSETSDQDGQVEKLDYFPDGEVKTVTDADNRVTRRFYNALHQLVREELPGPGQRRRVLEVSVHGDISAETDGRGNTTRHSHDSLGRRTGTTFPVTDSGSAEVRMEYDDVGNLLQQTNGRSQPTSYTYNDLNQRTGQEDAQNCGGGACTQSWTYDREGNVLTHTDRRGVVTTNRYDLENRLLSQTRAGLAVQTLERDANGNVTAQRDALSRLTSRGYDAANRKTSEERASLARESWTYTPLGDIQSHTDADHRTTSFTYSKRRYLLSESLAGETTHYSYDGMGHRLSMTRPKGEVSEWIYTYDGAGRLQTVEDPLAGTTTFGYDAADNRTSVEDAESRSTAFGYDERNRLTSKTYPGGKRWTWKYDADSNITEAKAPGGRTTDTSYDALNRPLQTNYGGASGNEVASSTYVHDGNGNLTSVSESGGGTRTETRSYDDFDRVLGVTDGNGRHLVYEYDDVGNRTALVDHDNQRTTWTYNALNHNTRASVPGQGITAQAYTDAGKLESVTRPDGSTSAYIYNDTGRLASITHAKSGAVLARYTYRYDPNGNRTEQTEINGAATAGAVQSTTYIYDDADRLSEVREPGRKSVYTLDKVGNRTHERVTDAGNVVISDSTLDYNSRDQLTGRSDPVAGVQLTQTWDDNGNLATQTVNGGAPRNYSYDARDRLIGLSLPGGPALGFRYHAGGLRSEKTDGASTTRYQYDGQSLLAETNAIGNTLRQYHYSASHLLGETKAGTTPLRRQYLLDALRSPIALLQLDGTLSARTSYDAFGEIRAQVGTSGALSTPNREAANAELLRTDDQAVGFTGYIKDSESGLYYARARYYDPAVARFTSEDPEAGKDLQPPSLHRYLYAYANPTVYIDPDGRRGCDSTRCGLLQTREMMKTPEDRARIDALMVHDQKIQRMKLGMAYGAVKETALSVVEIAKFAAKMYLSDVIDFEGSDTVVSDTRKIMDHWSRGPSTVISEYYEQKGERTRQLFDSGQEFEAGSLYGPELAFLSGGAWGVGRRIGTAVRVVESADSVPAIVAAVPEVAAPAPRMTWNQFQTATKGEFASRTEAGLAYQTYKRLENLPENVPQGVPYEGLMHRYEVPERTATTWDTHKWNVGANHRYTAPGLGGVYGGATQQTALAEVAHYGVEAGRVPISRPVNLTNAIDLTDPPVLEAIGVTRGQITGNSYAVTHQIGAWAKRRGYDGIIAPSARDSAGANIVSFSSVPEPP